MRRSLVASVLLLCAMRSADAAPASRVKQLKITVLSTMLADSGIGEWGFAAFVEVDGRRILFDTGARPRTVLENARELGIDLSTVTEVVLSHNHSDHTGGLLALRDDAAKKNASALSRVHVGDGIFWSRPGRAGQEANTMIATRRDFEASGGTFVIHDQPAQIAPGVWVTGRVPRVHPERNFPPGGRVSTPKGVVEDDLPEDLSLIFDTEQGLVLLSGCGHAGIVNTIEHARKIVRPAPLFAAIGGFHLFPADENTLVWTAQQLSRVGLTWLLGAHCTGIEAVYRLRDLVHLDRRHAVVGAVGASFDLRSGIDPLDLAR